MNTASTDVTLYVAFSIRGTNTFITASKTVPRDGHLVELFKLGQLGFEVARSRRANFNSTTEVKLHWDKLLTKKEKRQLRDPSRVLHQMRKLKALGFSLDEKNFIDYHFRSSHVKDNSVPR